MQATGWQTSRRVPKSGRRLDSCAADLCPIAVVLLISGVALTVALSAEASDARARVWVLPFEIDADFRAAIGDAVISRFVPLNTIYISDDWKVVNIALQAYVNVVQPDGAPDSVIRLGVTFPFKLPERRR